MAYGEKVIHVEKGPVEIRIDMRRGVLWVNTDQGCVLRVCKMKGLIYDASPAVGIREKHQEMADISLENVGLENGGLEPIGTVGLETAEERKRKDLTARATPPNHGSPGRKLFARNDLVTRAFARWCKDNLAAPVHGACGYSEEEVKQMCRKAWEAALR